MDWWKLTFSHHFSNALPRGRKVISGLGIGAGASLVLLILIWFSPSVKSPFGKPIFQGYPSFSRNSSIISWPFSLPTTSLSSSSSSSSSGVSNATASASSHPVNKTHVVNVSQTAKSGKLLGSGVVLEKPHGLNTSDSENTRKGFSKWKIGRIPEEGFPQEGKNVSVSANETMAGRDLNKTSMAKSAGSIGNSTVGNLTASGSKSVGNQSSTVGHLMPPNKQERTSKANGRGNIPKKDNFIPLHSQTAKGGQGSLFGGCDIFDGRWVRDDYSDPYYPAGSCPYIDKDFDCHFNGRPDDGYVRWKWKPLGCDIPSLNGTDFLERLRGKKLVFVGDSLNRNMWESLVCILRSNIQNKEKVYEISGNTNFKKKGVYAFRFEDYNCSVDFVSSPFLVRESYFNGKNRSFETLRLDLMDGTTSMYHDADVVVFNTGHWWTHEKTSRGEDYYQEGNYVHPRLKVLTAYQRALNTWATWVDRNINRDRTQVFFRGFSVTHFRGGQWNSGGQCHKETEPISNDTFLANYPSKMRALEHVLHEMRTPITYLNISRLTDYRKDAHPSIYRKKYETAKERHAAEQSQDCSHWCLPGVPDTWNQLLYVSLLNSGRGSWNH